jgi:hypothetical protein
VVNGTLGPARPLEDVDDILSYVDHELPHLMPRAAGQKRLRNDEPEGSDGPDVVAPGWVQIQQGKLTTRLY